MLRLFVTEKNTFCLLHFGTKSMCFIWDKQRIAWCPSMSHTARNTIILLAHMVWPSLVNTKGQEVLAQSLEKSILLTNLAWSVHMVDCMKQTQVFCSTFIARNNWWTHLKDLVWRNLHFLCRKLFLSSAAERSKIEDLSFMSISFKFFRSQNYAQKSIVQQKNRHLGFSRRNWYCE